MRPALNRDRATRGLTLLELVVAVLILAIGSIAAFRAMDQSGRVIGGALPRLLAQVAAENRAEELRLYGVAVGRSLPGEVSQGPYVVHLTQSFEATAAGLTEARIVARAADGTGAGALLVTYLPPLPPGGP